MASTDLGAIGRILQGTYRLEQILGHGGMGTVYQAAHTRIQKSVAIKMLAPEVAENAEALERFNREAQITSGLGHPHIVEVLDFNHTEQGIPYLVMEMLAGEDLEAHLQGARRLDFYDVSRIFGQTAKALSAAHQHQIVHRDLKPQNIFLSHKKDHTGQDQCWVKILDFGISKMLDATNAVTRANALMGTPAYMSPEVAEGRASEVDPRTDIYSLAVIVYEMLAGKPPFSDENMLILLNKILAEAPPSLCQQRPELPQAIESVIFQALAKNVDDRFSSMDAFWHAFVNAATEAKLPCYGANEATAAATPAATTNQYHVTGTTPQPSTIQPGGLIIADGDPSAEFDEYDATIPDMSPPSLLLEEPTSRPIVNQQAQAKKSVARPYFSQTAITELLRRPDTRYAAFGIGLFAIGTLLGWAWRRNVSAEQLAPPSNAIHQQGSPTIHKPHSDSEGERGVGNVKPTSTPPPASAAITRMTNAKANNIRRERLLQKQKRAKRKRNRKHRSH